MKQTPQLSIQYPSQYDDNSYSTIESGLNTIDAALGAAREDRNFVVYSTAVFSLTSGGVLTWDAPIYIKRWASSSSVLATIAAGSVTLSNGQVAYVALTRNGSAGYAPTVVAASTLPAANSSFVLFARQDIGSIVAVFSPRSGGAIYANFPVRALMGDRGPSMVTALIKSGETVASGDVVEIASGGIRKSATSSTKTVGVALIGGVGDGSTVYCTYAISGIVMLVVENSQTTALGEGVKLGGTANHIRPSGAGTYTGSLGIALSSVVGNGVLTCPVQLRPLGG